MITDKRLIGVVIGLIFASTAMAQAPEDRLMGYPRSAVEAALPNLPTDQLDLLVYRIPTIHQILQNSGQ